MASSIPVITLNPVTPEDYDLEHNITWDEIAPSLQAKFVSIGDLINNNLNTLQKKIIQTRITIASRGPINPEKDREIWFDTDEKIFKIYESKNDDNKYKWERTRAAWYGGSLTDVEFPQVNYNSQPWLLVSVLAWVSNAAKNGTYDPTTDLPMQSYHIVPKDSTYFIRDETSLFVYNKQKSYTHDGGAIRVVVFHQTADRVTTQKLMDNEYDSKTKYSSYNTDTKTYNNATVDAKRGDLIYFQLTVTRNPTSTDDIEIYISTVINMFRKNNNTSSDPEIDRTPYVEVWRDLGVNDV